jgi:hypothetical protein
VNGGQEGSGRERRGHASDQGPRLVHGEEAGDGPDEHHALDPEVDDPGPLGDDLSERGEEEGRAGCDGRGQEGGQGMDGSSF